jgi:hypothetical protein
VQERGCSTVIPVILCKNLVVMWLDISDKKGNRCLCSKTKQRPHLMKFSGAISLNNWLKMTDVSGTIALSFIGTSCNCCWCPSCAAANYQTVCPLWCGGPPVIRFFNLFTYLRSVTSGPSVRRSLSHATTDGQSVSMSRCRAHSGTCDQILLSVRRLLSESLVSVGRPLWREVGSVICHSQHQ